MSSNSQRTPTLAVYANGVSLPNVMEADIFANAHFAAARFRLRLAVPTSTAAALLQPGTVLDVQIGDGGPPRSLIQGEADTITVDAINQTLEIDGRDLTARLLDTRTQETFSNQTASEIAATLASRHGLAANITKTTTLAGRYYAAEHERITLGQSARATTEWDLLTFLAAREGFDVFVTAQTLTFAPPANAMPAITLTPADCLSLSLSHALTLARDIAVTVKSWKHAHPVPRSAKPPAVLPTDSAPGRRSVSCWSARTLRPTRRLGWRKGYWRTCPRTSVSFTLKSLGRPPSRHAASYGLLALERHLTRPITSLSWIATSISITASRNASGSRTSPSPAAPCLAEDA